MSEHEKIILYHNINIYILTSTYRPTSNEYKLVILNFICSYYDDYNYALQLLECSIKITT